MSRSERKNVGFSVSPFDLAKMHGFNPSSWRKRADGVVEMLVENSAGSFPAWFRATPQAELYVLEGPSDLPYPAWTKASSVKWNPARTDIAANAEASVMATLLPAQLWRQANGAGNEWAMWELQRRGITSMIARPNPKLSAFIGGGSGLRMRHITVHGSGPLGGYSPKERAGVPTSMFLKPSTRSWPVSDENHAHIALQYMTRGFGGRQEYPSLVRRLATLWPVSQNPEIWADYSSKKRSIESKCGCRMPSLSELGG